MVTLLLSSSTGTLAGHDSEEEWSNISPQLLCYLATLRSGEVAAEGVQRLLAVWTAQASGYQGSFSIPVQGFS